MESRLLHQVGKERQYSEVAGAFNGGSHTALIFQAVTGDTTWQNFGLFVNKLKQKVCVFIVNIFNTELAEAAVFFAAQPKARVAEEFYIFS
jgi:hypothetical protein